MTRRTREPRRDDLRAARGIGLGVLLGAAGWGGISVAAHALLQALG